MMRYFDRRSRIPWVGRYGDQIDFQDLSVELQTEEVATIVGALRAVNDTDVIACGSPAETESIPELGSHYQVSTMDWWEALDTLETPAPLFRDYKFVLENVAIKADDQLRQRVAWSLSNFIVISDRDFDAGHFSDGWTGFYDIFVRHAFGNYLDILRDVSYHPLMGVYLSYYGNKAFVIENNYPDENYAREIMQLFSIGLWRLNEDGTQKLGENGLPEETYTNDDIMDFARLWTGFDRLAGRNNLGNFHEYFNAVDPMYIRAQWRDRLPKAKLDSGYLGDTYPLCDDLPTQTFLRKGARYEYTGASSVEGDELDAEDPGTVGRRGRLDPTPGSSALHQALCRPSQEKGGACSFPLVVVLDNDLQCNGNKECNAQRVLAVKIYDPVADITRYYSYIAPPCVRLSLFDSGKLLTRQSNIRQCADPIKRAGGPVCCSLENPSVPATDFTSECMFANEVTDYATMEQRCAGLNLTACAGDMSWGSSWRETCAYGLYMWTSASCSVQLQVYRTGRVAIIDPSAPQFRLFQPNSNNFFRVRWADNIFPMASSGSCPNNCALQPTPAGDSCICNFTVSSGPVFSQMSDLRTFSSNDTEKLPIGAPNPDLFDDGTYTTCGSQECSSLSNVVVWLHKDDNGGLSERTIFQLPPVRLGSRVRYLLNRLSTVTIDNQFSFRNPPSFAPLLGELHDITYVAHFSDSLWSRKAEYEVEALLEHLFEHPNTPMFVSYRLIQHMVTSNPSPRYVKSVAQAFSTGVYGDMKFSQRYGDLAATVYAILMDHEARSPIVEADITFGMLRDPLIKLYHVMRSLSYESPTNREIYMLGLDDSGGVQPLSSPSVFGFYLPEFRPLGIIGEAGLVAPQVQIATTPNLMSFLNGLTSLIEWGLTACDGFGVWGSPTLPYRLCDYEYGARATSDGELSWKPDTLNTMEIIDELDLLLTAGRLHEKNRQVLADEYEKMRSNETSYDTEAIRHLLKLLVTTPEFDTNTYNHITDEVREPRRTLPPTQGRPFKAIVVIFESGGSDSFNILVPHSDCPDKDMYEEYRTVREGAAIEKSVLLPIQVPASTQPCNTFGIHPAMPNLHSLYNDEDLLFTANVGVLIEPVTQQSYLDGRAKLPPSLGAHNIMTRSVQNAFAQSVSANGVLGRLADAMFEVDPPFPTGLFSVAGNQKAVQGKTPAEFIAGASGVVRLRELQELKEGLGNITSFKSRSLFAESQTDLLFSSLNSTETLGELLRSTTTNVTFGATWLENQMQQVARLIKALPTAGYERAVFLTSAGGFDTHGTFDLNGAFGVVDQALGKFVEEIKIQGRWDDVTVMSFSEFGRTMTSNGAGTDHGWGSNNFIAGGSVRGGRVLGQYPTVLSDESELSLGRGRLIPTTPFEAQWNALGEWFGVTPELMNDVLPNLANFPKEQIFTKEDVFEP
jgi:uncharacterized protein (DUF1501 family)/uncharacterized protein (DUF1800 family)